MRRNHAIFLSARRHRRKWIDRRTKLVLAMLIAVLAYTVHSRQGSGPLFGASTPAVNRPAVLNGGNAWGGVRRAMPGSSADSRVLKGPVTHVRDGDTIEISGVAVRIANLDCAERGTARGDRATARMNALVSSERLDCRLTGKRSYDRVVATCRMGDGRDIGAVLVSEGVCGFWR